MKRGYKLQEFVAHSSNVNCVKIGKKSSRVVVTGGEDHKVNLWAIGKPNSILSLSGHTSPVESLTFDSSEVLVVAGASSGTLKLWDLEEAKVVRTLTGHRSNCISVDFHPFGEFFASGSLDTNIKIWDMRKKGCIHTYKGHSRGVTAVKFTPDGRWLVSGGEDHVIKLWDLTAGKLLHDFKSHEGQIQCIDFHPHEFLLATGSTDRTVKFWDLETFELIGSAGPESTAMRSMAFNPDGRTLFCGLHESLKVFSWEPVRCHDTVDMGWSKLADLSVQEGKLLGCSFNQSCVGVWVADISCIAPYAVGGAPRNLPLEPKPNMREDQPAQQLESSMEASCKSVSTPLTSERKDIKMNQLGSSVETVSRSPQRVGFTGASKLLPSDPTTTSNASCLKKNVLPKVQPTISTQAIGKQDVIPVIVPRINQKIEPSTDLKTGDAALQRIGFASKSSHVWKTSVSTGDTSGESVSNQNESSANKTNELNSEGENNFFPLPDVKDVCAGFDEENATSIRDISAKTEISLTVGNTSSNRHEGGHGKLFFGNRRTRSVEKFKEKKSSIVRTNTFVDSWERRERFSSDDARSMSVASHSPDHALSISNNGLSSTFDNYDYENDLKDHELFLSDIQTHLAKLQVVRHFWERNDVKGAIFTMDKMSDHSVQADVISILVEKIDIVTLDICACVLPILTGLLCSKFDRHINISLEMLLKLVRIFGPVIHSTVSGPTLVGVDLHAEERLARCNQCFVELQTIKQCVSSLLRKGGITSRTANELNLAIQEVGC